MKKSVVFASLFSLAFLGLARGAEPAAPAPAAAPELRLVSVHKIWDAAPHQAFTSLVRYHDKWVCAFREASRHVGGPLDSRIRVLTSDDAESWTPVAELKDPRGDIRDAKMAVLPDGRLTLLTCTNCIAPDAPTKGYQSIAFFTTDLKTWTPPHDVGDHGVWLWGVAVHDGAAYSIGYGAGGPGGRFVRLYKSTDGETYEPVVRKFDIPDAFPNENAIRFDDDDAATCLLRCDPASKSDTAYAFLGTAKAPYTDWTWKRLNARVGGPALTRTPSGELLGAGRLYEPKPHTALFFIDPATSTLTEALKLPSGGDTSYPGLVWQDGTLYVSYYSSHEGKTSIYLARVRPAAPAK